MKYGKVLTGRGRRSDEGEITGIERDLATRRVVVAIVVVMENVGRFLLGVLLLGCPALGST
jgi:hypothetical protein